MAGYARRSHGRATDRGRDAHPAPHDRRGADWRYAECLGERRGVGAARISDGDARRRPDHESRRCSGANLDFGPIERNGEMALQAFLAMYLMSLKLWTIGGVIVPLALNVALQILITTLVAFLMLFRLLGRDYDAALTPAASSGSD